MTLEKFDYALGFVFGTNCFEKVLGYFMLFSLFAQHSVIMCLTASNTSHEVFNFY